MLFANVILKAEQYHLKSEKTRFKNTISQNNITISNFNNYYNSLVAQNKSGGLIYDIYDKTGKTLST